MKKSGALIVIEALCRNKVETVFGYPGGAVLPIYDELYKNSHRIKYVVRPRLVQSLFFCSVNHLNTNFN